MCLQLAEDECRHFQLLERRLRETGMAYGDLLAHDGLWDSARETGRWWAPSELLVCPPSTRGPPTSICFFNACSGCASFLLHRKQLPFTPCGHNLVQRTACRRGWRWSTAPTRRGVWTCSPRPSTASGKDWLGIALPCGSCSWTDRGHPLRCCGGHVPCCSGASPSNSYTV